MNNFQYIKKNDINREKWDKCVSESINSRVYALSWYLDIVCKNWDGIIFGDYEAVFPVIFKKIFFIKKSYHPLFCQQLGHFYKNENLINEDNLILFHRFFKKHFNEYTFCSTSEFAAQFSQLQSSSLFLESMNSIFWNSKANLELDLKRNYNDIKDLYNKNTIRNLKKSESYNLKIQKNLSVNTFLELYKTNKKIKKSIKNIFSFNDNYSIIRDLIYTCLSKNKGQLIAVFDQKNNIASAAFFLSCFNRYIMLFNVTNPIFKKYHGMTFLVDYFIHSHSNQSNVLDFEGSNLEGVRRFYSGFGTLSKPYFSFQKFK